MADKRSDDFVVRLPDVRLSDDKERFIPKVSSRRASAAVPETVATFVSTIEGSGSASVVAYCLSSISMTLVNKYVVSGNSWNLHLFYLAIQSIIGTVTILACKQLGMIKELDSFDAKRAQRWFPISLLLVGMIFTGNKALQFLSVPVYTIFKNLTIIVIAYGEVLWFGGSVSPLSLVSFGLMVFSSVVAAWSDFQHAKALAADGLHQASTAISTLNAGYAWMTINVFCSALYVLSMRKAIKLTNFKNWDVMFYNNLLTIPVLIISSLLFEDWSSPNLHRNFPPASRQSLVIGMVYSGLAAIFISYCTAWCIRATSSTTYAMAGALNKLPMAIAGLVFFSDPVTFGSVTAIFLGFVSGLLYTLAKNNKKSPPSGPSLPTSTPMSASARSEKDAANS
ncbi:GDP-mannose transporter [Tolypocladium capitatum]|uniref:GDP-mannose transporter n=1 Tax=Tolypocladium capitatum TaxID=45235 RepID=A0A2K3QGZ4_9HYPO|nr:GDP-mannose transporter [Tolypocladium capitatum]